MSPLNFRVEILPLNAMVPELGLREVVRSRGWRPRDWDWRPQEPLPLAPGEDRDQTSVNQEGVFTSSSIPRVP